MTSSPSAVFSGLQGSQPFINRLSECRDLDAARLGLKHQSLKVGGDGDAFGLRVGLQPVGGIWIDVDSHRTLLLTA